ncbi:hypothetical protein ACA910_004098 [Epithemia clementina (nom. ined.)]
MTTQTTRAKTTSLSLPHKHGRHLARLQRTRNHHQRLFQAKKQCLLQQQKQKHHQQLPPAQQLPRPPWMTSKKTKHPNTDKNTKTKKPYSVSIIHNTNGGHLVARYVHLRQEEIWNEFAHEFLDPLFPNPQDDALLQVLEGLYYMGITRSILEHVAQLVFAFQQQQRLQGQGQQQQRHNTQIQTNSYNHRDEALFGLAQYLAHGVTRVPTPFGISQRLALLHVICTLCDGEPHNFGSDPNHNRLRNSNNSSSMDPVLLWHFLLGGKDHLGSYQEGFNNNDSTVSGKSQPKGDENHFDFNPDAVWCWELRALTMACLAKDEAERRWAHATADEVAHAVGMAAITVELGLNQSTELVCHGMGRGCEWIKSQWLMKQQPVADGHEEEMNMLEPQEQHQLFVEDGESNDFIRFLLDDEGFEDEEALSETSSLTSMPSSTMSAFTNTTVASTFSRMDCSSAKSIPTSIPRRKTKEGIVKDAYISYSRSARQATETARETTQMYVNKLKQSSSERLRDAALTSRAWATQHVYANPQHWAYLDALATVSLASLGAMGLLGEAMFRNTQVLLDHTRLVLSDLIHHQFGPTAGHLFDDVTRSTTNVTRMTSQILGLMSPASFTRSLVKQAGKERLRQQYAKEQTTRHHSQPSTREQQYSWQT